eukprot:Skav210830  [mRNA]  locus=scaffold1597:422249:423466:- [translate_table: standard]
MLTVLNVNLAWRACRGVLWPSGFGAVPGFSFFSTLPRATEKCWQVSSHGRVCNTKGVISHGNLTASGYRSINIGGYQFFVHHVVVLTFSGPSTNAEAYQVNHRDGNRSNNHLNNLERMTRTQNIQHSFRNPWRKLGGFKLLRPVMWRAVGSQGWVMCESAQQAAEQVGLKREHVSRCCRSASLAKGLEFRYSDQQSMQGEQWRQMFDPKSGQEVAGRKVSSLGRIKYSNGRISTGHLERNGYRSARVTLASHSRNELIHRLVAFAFLGAPPSAEHTQINHKDGNKSNNRLENLEYVTPAMNVHHYYSNKCAQRTRVGGKPVASRLHGSGHAWAQHPSISSAGKVLNISPASISRCISGKLQQTRGFEFRLLAGKEPEEFAGEEWSKVDLAALLQEKEVRKAMHFR